MNAAAAKHLTAIEAGQVDKSNVIGIRKAFNAYERASRGYSVSRTAPAWSIDDLDAVILAIHRHKPRVVGDLHASGVKVLRNPRYLKRWTGAQLSAIEGLTEFRLVDFEEFKPGNFVPVYEVRGTEGGFQFRNVAWQSGGDGPEVVS